MIKSFNDFVYDQDDEIIDLKSQLGEEAPTTPKNDQEKSKNNETSDDPYEYNYYDYN